MRYESASLHVEASGVLYCDSTRVQTSEWLSFIPRHFSLITAQILLHLSNHGRKVLRLQKYTLPWLGMGKKKEKESSYLTHTHTKKYTHVESTPVSLSNPNRFRINFIHINTSDRTNGHGPVDIDHFLKHRFCVPLLSLCHHWGPNTGHRALEPSKSHGWHLANSVSYFCWASKL